MNMQEYMGRRCVCGQLRSHHVHFDEYSLGRKRDTGPGRPTGRFHVLPASHGNACTGFLDEIELELRGNPATNALLAPLVADSARAAGVTLDDLSEEFSA